jgi:hypothetical protein
MSVQAANDTKLQENIDVARPPITKPEDDASVSDTPDNTQGGLVSDELEPFISQAREQDIGKPDSQEYEHPARGPFEDDAFGAAHVEKHMNEDEVAPSQVNLCPICFQARPN